MTDRKENLQQNDSMAENEVRMSEFEAMKRAFDMVIEELTKYKNQVEELIKCKNQLEELLRFKNELEELLDYKNRDGGEMPSIKSLVQSVVNKCELEVDKIRNILTCKSCEKRGNAGDSGVDLPPHKKIKSHETETVQEGNENASVEEAKVEYKENYTEDLATAEEVADTNEDDKSDTDIVIDKLASVTEELVSVNNDDKSDTTLTTDEEIEALCKDVSNKIENDDKSATDLVSNGNMENTIPESGNDSDCMTVEMDVIIETYDGTDYIGFDSIPLVAEIYWDAQANVSGLPEPSEDATDDELNKNLAHVMEVVYGNELSTDDAQENVNVLPEASEDATDDELNKNLVDVMEVIYGNELRIDDAQENVSGLPEASEENFIGIMDDADTNENVSGSTADQTVVKK